MNRHLIYKQSQRIILYGALSNVFLAFLKIIFGYTSHSHGLLADGFHSLSDLVVDFLVLFAAQFGIRDADADHPYGHARIETAATMGLALFLTVIGFGIMIDAGTRLYHSVPIEKPHLYAVFVIIFSLMIKEFLYHWTLKIANQLNSELLRANAWHHRSDSASSLVVLFGLIGALAGFEKLDMIAAIIVSILIIKMGLDLAWNSIRELVDTGLDEESVKRIEAVIRKVPGVLAVHKLRSRSMAGNIFVDVHILVHSDLTVSEGHFISQKVHDALLRYGNMIHDVTVHVDVNDDSTFEYNRDLPARDKLLPQFMMAWRDLPGASQIAGVSLHYLNGQIDVEIKFPIKIFPEIDDVKQLQKQYLKAVKSLKVIRQINLIFLA